MTRIWSFIFLATSVSKPINCRIGIRGVRLLKIKVFEKERDLNFGKITQMAVKKMDARKRWWDEPGAYPSAIEVVRGSLMIAWTKTVLCLVIQSCLTLCNPMDCSSCLLGDSRGQNTRLGCHALLQRIFPTQGFNPGLPYCRWILYYLSQQGSPELRLR